MAKDDTWASNRVKQFLKLTQYETSLSLAEVADVEFISKVTFCLFPMAAVIN